MPESAVAEHHEQSLVPARTDPPDLILDGEITVATVMQQGEFQFFSIHEASVIFKPECPEDNWRELTTALAAAFQGTGQTHCRLIAKLCDALNFGFNMYGERASSVIDATRGYMKLAAKTIDNAMTTFARIPEHIRRVDEISFEHHKCVQKLTHDEQKEFLETAIREGWSVAALKDAINERHPKNKASKGRSAPSDKIDEQDALKAAHTVLDYFVQAEAEEGSAGKWDAERKKAWKPLMAEMYKVTRRVSMNQKWRKKKA